MKEIIKIPEIHYFYGFYKEYFLLESMDWNNVLFFTQKDCILSHKIQIRDPSLNIKDNIYIYDKGSILIYCDEKKNFILYKKSQAEQYAIFNDEYLCGYNYNRESKSLTVTFFDRNSQNKLWQQTYENRVFPLSYYENLFLSDIRITFLEKIDLKTGKSEWILDFGMKVHGDILKFGDTLIIPLDNDHLLGINAATGEKLWELEDCLNYYCLEETTGLLYGYARERFEIIDAARGEKILRKQLTGSMDKYEISPDQSMNVLAGDAIYFVSNWKVSSKIGKINVRTQEIEFVQELIKEEKGEGRTLAGTPVYHNGRLYIKDSVGVLHIFEEE